MAREERILAVDIGATSIKLCEFDFGGGDGIALSCFAQREYEEELSDTTRMNVVSGLLRQMLAEGGFKARKAMLCMSGQYSLLRFSHLPTLGYDKKRIRQLAEFEATQNIPFPVDQVIMDYQLIPSPTGDGLESMSVVIRNDIAEQFTSAITQVGLQPILIDVTAAACYNAARANGIGDDGCALLLNIGGRVTNMIFVEGEHLYARTIPIAGYTITQQIAKEFGIGLPEAEELKRHHGFVALGGAYAEPESETAANVSKIIRNVMIRLYGEISRTINVYRSQQKGSAPVKMYITGGSSIFTYCDTFFNEKMNIPVEYFNPFMCCKILPSVDRERLSEVGHMFSETIGLGLRYCMQCPVELSLIPANIRRQQNVDKKKPYIVLGFIAVILMLLVLMFGIMLRRNSYYAADSELQKIIAANKSTLEEIESAQSTANDNNSKMQAVADLVLQQAKWPAILNEIYRNKPDNLWITSMKPIIGAVKAFESKSAAAMSEENMMFGGDFFGGGEDMGMMGMGDGTASEGASTAQIGGIEIEGCCVGVDNGGVYINLGPLGAFPFAVEKELPKPEDAQSESGEDSGSEEGEAKSKVSKESPQVVANKLVEARMKAAGEPVQAYLAALRMSQLFDADEKMTTITKYELSSAVPNFATFKMQLKFSMNVDFLQVKGGGSAKKNQ